ncbi:MAG: hypothetical protein ACFFD1_12900, partial [Candidatus Thorarchaeota archaeon]
TKKTLTSTLPYLEIMYSNIKKPRGSKTVNWRENLLLEQITKITYLNQLSESNLAYFFPKNSPTIPWIIENVQNYEEEQVKLFIEKSPKNKEGLTKLLDNQSLKKIKEKETTEQTSSLNIKKRKKQRENIKEKKKKGNIDEMEDSQEPIQSNLKSSLNELIEKKEKENNKEEKKKTKKLLDFL